MQAAMLSQSTNATNWLNLPDHSIFFRKSYFRKGKCQRILVGLTIHGAQAYSAVIQCLQNYRPRLVRFKAVSMLTNVHHIHQHWQHQWAATSAFHVLQWCNALDWGHVTVVTLDNTWSLFASCHNVTNSRSLENCFVAVDGICCRRMLVGGTAARGASSLRTWTWSLHPYKTMSISASVLYSNWL